MSLRSTPEVAERLRAWRTHDGALFSAARRVLAEIAADPETTGVAAPMLDGRVVSFEVRGRVTEYVVVWGLDDAGPFVADVCSAAELAQRVRFRRAHDL